MRRPAKITNCEGALLAAALFFALVMAVHAARDREPPYTVITIPRGTPWAEAQRMMGLLDINTAPIRDLQKIPGLRPEVALDIAQAVSLRGPFASMEEAVEVLGVDEKTAGILWEYCAVYPQEEEQTGEDTGS